MIIRFFTRVSANGVDVDLSRQMEMDIEPQVGTTVDFLDIDSNKNGSVFVSKLNYHVDFSGEVVEIVIYDLKVYSSKVPLNREDEIYKIDPSILGIQFRGWKIINNSSGS